VVVFLLFMAFTVALPFLYRFGYRIDVDGCGITERGFLGCAHRDWTEIQEIVLVLGLFGPAIVVKTKSWLRRLVFHPGFLDEHEGRRFLEICGLVPSRSEA
jgi:hypothetical protein